MKVDLDSAPVTKTAQSPRCMLARWLEKVDEEQRPGVLGVIFQPEGGASNVAIGEWLVKNGLDSKDPAKIVGAHRRGDCTGCAVHA